MKPLLKNLFKQSQVKTFPLFPSLSQCSTIHAKQTTAAAVTSASSPLVEATSVPVPPISTWPTISVPACPTVQPAR